MNKKVKSISFEYIFTKKGKVVPVHVIKGKRKQKCSSTHVLFHHSMEVSGQLHELADVHPRKEP